MANVAELKDALKETLEESGTLNEVRAIMRERIFKAISSDTQAKPKLSNENLIINELIREYLIYNNYLHSNSVLLAESGQPHEPPFDRNFIAKELNIVEENSSKRIPLLYSILFGLKKESYQPNDNNHQLISNMNPLDMVNSTRMKMNSGSSGMNMNANINMMNSQPVNSSVSNVQNVLSGQPNQNDQPKPWIIE
jgi:lisH domain-containing protein FOPNL